MSENDKNIEINIKGKISPDKDSKRNQDRKRLNEQTNKQRQQNESESLADQESSGSQDDILPSLDEVDESENTDGLNDVDEGLVEDEENEEQEEGSEEDSEEQEEDSEEQEEDSDEDSEEQEEDSEEQKDGEEDSDENDDESKNEENSDDSDDSDDKTKDSKESSSENNKYNNNQDRMNLNPNRAEASKGPDTSKTPDLKEGGAGSKLADKAKGAVGDKLMANENVKKAKKAAEAVSNTVTTAANVGNWIIQLVINPATWVALGAVILFIYTASFLTSVGQNDFNIMCDDSGVGSISIDSDADDFTRQAAIASWFTSTPFEINGGQPFTDEQAAGVIGNMVTESYGADPRAIQGDATMTEWETCDNDCVLGWGNVGGKAIGVVQWDRGRRIGLVNFAKQEGTQWHDLTTQLKFLKQEIESGYERDQLESGGFNQPGKTVAEYTKIWNTHFERSEAAGTPEGDNPRIANAEEFASSFTGGSFSFAGLSDSCVGGGLFAGGGIDTSSLVQLAIQSAHTKRSSALENCGPLTNCGQNTATDAYKQAKIAAEAATNNDPIRGLLASCDRFVATMYRATGKDPSFPWGDTSVQINYMRNSPDWEQVSCQDRQPGDVLWRAGHTMLYVGMVNGTDSIASASLGHRSGNLSSMSCQGAQFLGDGDTAIGFRKVN